MQDAEIPVVERQVNGCLVRVSFVAEPVEGVMDKMKSILSNAYDERVQEDLMKLASLK